MLLIVISREWHDRSFLWASFFRALGYRTANDILKCGAANLGDLNAGCQANCSDINLTHVFCIVWIRNRGSHGAGFCLHGSQEIGGPYSEMLSTARWGHLSFALLSTCWKCKKLTCADNNDILKWKHFILFPLQALGKKSTVKPKQGSLCSVWNGRVRPDEGMSVGTIRVRKMLLHPAWGASKSPGLESGRRLVPLASWSRHLFSSDLECCIFKVKGLN